MGKPTNTPSIRDSAGYIVWLIIGSGSESLLQIGPKLNIDPRQLSDLIHSKSLSLLQRAVPGLRESLPKIFPESWAKYADQFNEAVVRDFGRPEIFKPPAPPVNGWRVEVGTMLRCIREREGDDLKEISRFISSPAVKLNAERLERGDPSLPWSLYAGYADELTEVYGFRDDDKNIAPVRARLDLAYEQSRKRAGKSEAHSLRS